jgi:acyl-CoA synthetase (NDP forming)
MASRVSRRTAITPHHTPALLRDRGKKGEEEGRQLTPEWVRCRLARHSESTAFSTTFEREGSKIVASHPIIERALQQRQTLLTETESKQVLHDLGIATTLGQLATSEDEAAKFATDIGFPVVLKISSPDITHKSDVGGVQLHLQNAEDVRCAYQTILHSVAEKSPAAHLEGVVVQPMAKPGVEVIIGMSQDTTFGPVLMFGLGGVLVEILKDVAFRIVPLNQRDAEEMIRDIKGFPLLQGYRGAPAVDLNALTHMLLTLSDFVAQTPAIKEIDLNPVYAYDDGALAVDARLILDTASASA